MELNQKNAEMLLELIKKRCSASGRVTPVEAHREPSPFAPVEMSRRDQTEKLPSQHQGSQSGSAPQGQLEHKCE